MLPTVSVRIDQRAAESARKGTDCLVGPSDFASATSETVSVVPEGCCYITGRQHDPRDEQRHLRRHLLGAPRVRHHRRRHRPSPRTPRRRSRTTTPVLSGFEAIDQGRRILEAGAAAAASRRTANENIWDGNVQLLEQEQRALVQRNLDRLSCAFARLFSIGSALTFDVRGVRHELMYSTAFYLYSLTLGIPQADSCADVAEDHPLRRPLALDRHEHRPPLPEIRCRRHGWSNLSRADGGRGGRGSLPGAGLRRS